MISGAHSIIYSTNAEADRAFLRDVLGFPSVDVGEGWLIFGLPPSELAVHPAGENDVHELYLITDEVKALVAALQKRGIACSEIQDRGWGLLTQLTLPGGGKLGVYQPRHARPKAGAARKTRRAAKTAGRTARTTARASVRQTRSTPAGRGRRSR
jgi:hypothetical protein